MSAETTLARSGGGLAPAVYEMYDPRKFNVLLPVTLAADGGLLSPLLAETFSVVQISMTPQSGETYHDFRYANERSGRFALTAQGLTRIANHAGIKWIPELCGTAPGCPQFRADGHIYTRYAAAAALRKPNGEWHVETAEKSVDTAVEAEEMEETFRRQVSQGRADWAKGKSAEEIDQIIAGKVRQQLLQFKKFMDGHAETKAKNRVIRRILTLKQVYSADELARPFVVPLVVYRPDITDPRQLEQIQLDGRRATADLYGTPGLPTHSHVGEGESREGSDSIRDHAGEPSVSGLPDDGTPSPAYTSRSAQGEAHVTGEGAMGNSADDSAAGDGEEPEGNGERNDVDPSGSEPPKEDFELPSGDHAGEEVSFVAAQHPEYLASVLQGRGDVKLPARQTRTAMQWLAFHQPMLFGGNQ